MLQIKRKNVKSRYLIEANQILATVPSKSEWHANYVKKRFIEFGVLLFISPSDFFPPKDISYLSVASTRRWGSAGQDCQFPKCKKRQNLAVRSLKKTIF
jgi:hypothetical protein